MSMITCKEIKYRVILLAIIAQIDYLIINESSNHSPCGASCHTRFKCPLQTTNCPSQFPRERKIRRPHGLVMRRMRLNQQTNQKSCNQRRRSSYQSHRLSLWRLHRPRLQIHRKHQKHLARSPLGHPSPRRKRSSRLQGPKAIWQHVEFNPKPNQSWPDR